MEKEWLYGKTLAELETVVLELGQKKFVARQLADWLYAKHVTEIGEMTNLSLRFRETLADRYTVGRIAPERADASRDGTKKYLYATLGGKFIESVYIPEGDRATLCISSQAGCRMGCAFCMTGRQGFQHNLTAGEILNQIRETAERDKLSNIVFMGMGEPLDNIGEVLRAIEIMTAPWGFGWSPTRITLSTVGVIPAMKRYLDGCKCHLTISMHAPGHAVRKSLMPVENRYPLEEVIRELRKYDFSHQRRLSFAYTVFDGVNDSRRDADAIIALLKGVHCRINLIPFHRIPDSDLRPAQEKRMVELRDYLSRHGITTTIRTSRGEDIDAACGLLSTKELLNH